MKLKIGTWVALTVDGLWYSPFGDGSEDHVAYKRKKDLVKDIAAANLDARSTPLVRKNGTHRYIYRVKDCDTGQFGESFALFLVTPENIAWLEGFLEPFKEDEPEPS